MKIKIESQWSDFNRSNKYFQFFELAYNQVKGLDKLDMYRLIIVIFGIVLIIDFKN